MTAWRNPRDKQVAVELFGALCATDLLTQHRDAPAPISFGRLYSFATGADSADDPDLRQALRDNPRLCQDLDRLLESTALCRFPRVAAASSGAVESREEKGFRITLHPSRAEAGQVYLLIRLQEPIAPRTLIVRRGNTYEKHALPEARDGVIQVLTEEGSPLVRAVRDIGTEIFLS